MEITINVSDQERVDAMRAIEHLNSLEHVRVMTSSMISDLSGIKTTKLRAVIEDLCKESFIVRYQATENPKIQRYYYVITPKGKELLSAAEQEAE